jgi:hypothetical protein
VIDDLKHLLRDRPFSPFRIVLMDGGAYDVIERHQVAIGHTQLAYYYPGSDRKAAFPVQQLARFELMRRDDRR